MIRRLAVCVALLCAASVGPTAAQTLTESVASTTAELVPDPSTGWLPVDYVSHPLNPVYTPAERPDEAQSLTVLRVDHLPLSQRVYDGRWYLWNWTHGKSPRTLENGGRMRLATADSLEGPWTDRGFVTPKEGLAPPGWNRASWTAGDVVWSEGHRKFFSTPKSGRGRGAEEQFGRVGDDDVFLMESIDGVHWELSDVPQPVLLSGSGYDDKDIGYGRLLRIAGPNGAERWLYLFRGNEAFTPHRFYRYALAIADDIYGPWTKAADNPIFDPWAGGILEDDGAVDELYSEAGQPQSHTLMNLDAFLCYDGWFQILWQDVATAKYVSRSKDLREWETFAAFGADGVNPLGEGKGAPVFPGTGTGSNLVYDDTIGAWTLVFHGVGVTADGALARTANIARSLSGGIPPAAEPSAACPELIHATSLAVAGPGTVQATDTVELSATLSAEDEPLAGRTVEFSVGGLSTSAVTGADGVAGASLTADLDPGLYEVNARFGGDDAHWPSSATTEVEVVRETTVLTYTGPLRATGDVVELEAVLNDDDGTALGGQQVEFTIAGITVTAVTDATGRASTTATVADHGRAQTVHARYGGGPRYADAATSAVIRWGAPR